ncbi:MAG: rod shape-determining protein MreC [Oscillospiraceae bacterium]|nr:rod shape-determining protein MreC [Oscillospiraceae bacterium]
MREFIRKNGIIVVIAALLVAVIAVSSIVAGGSDAAGGAVNTLVRPVRGFMSGVVSHFERLYGYMYGYDILETENGELKERIATLEQEYREYDELAAENERLKKLLGFSEEHASYEMTQAAVLSQTASSWQSAFTISRGSASGLKEGCCVITESGFVIGRVTSVSSSSSVVTTLLDTTSSIGAVIWDTGETGVLSGDFELMKRGRAKLAYLPDSCTLSPGDTVITSGAGGVFPRGLVLGTVERVETSASGTSDWALISPSADLYNLEYVYVITSFGEE